MKKILLPVLALLFAHSVMADIRLPLFFSNNMVLQRDRLIPIWGWASPGEEVTVQLKDQNRTVKTGKDGRWKIGFDPEKAGGPYQLKLKGKNTILINNVLIGDVWICSGQSNMEFQVKNVVNAAAEIARADYPEIRHFKVPNTVAGAPQEDVKGGDWRVCLPSTVGDFTAVGYFFARELQATLKIPIGLINISWGGTHSETWTSREALGGSDEFRAMVAELPSLNFDSLARTRMKEAKERIRRLQGTLDLNEGEINSWKNSDFDDSRWATMKVPGLWEQQELGDLDGVVWFRKEVDLPAADAAGEGWLELAMIDDLDETYINGTKIGGMNNYNDHRKYRIPAGILKAGKNLIAVRVQDNGGGGGIWGDSAELKITTQDHVRSLAGRWKYRVASIASSTFGIGPNSYPSLLSNGMLNPFTSFAVRGVLWYQGEANAGRAFQYRKAFPLMIEDWRRRWDEGELPFYFVQLSSFNAADGNSMNGSTWAELREAQTMTLSLPNTGMAVTTDIGNAKDIHPKNKQDVGRRLAAIALHQAYGKNIPYSGPVYQSARTEAGKMIIAFSNTGSGLLAKDEHGTLNGHGELKGFEIAGADHQFHPARAEIRGSELIVSQEGLQHPVAVRYGWADDVGADNLFNKEGFPAGPFRTDDWKGITVENKFKPGN